MPTTDTKGTPSQPNPAFLTTHWSVVLSAGQSDTTRAHAALEHLCETYWRPLYTYVRRRGYSPADAQDLTQEFFARLLEHNWIESADPEKGRFRTFLLTAMTRFLANEWDKARAQKRGGGKPGFSLDTEAAEAGYRSGAAEAAAPDQFFDSQWAMTLLERAFERLRSEYKGDFAILSPYLAAARGEIPYGTLAQALDLSEAAARQSIHRLRKRFREVFREEIAKTVADPKDIEEEIRYLLTALAG